MSDSEHPLPAKFYFGGAAGASVSTAPGDQPGRVKAFAVSRARGPWNFRLVLRNSHLDGNLPVRIKEEVAIVDRTRASNLDCDGRGLCPTDAAFP